MVLVIPQLSENGFLNSLFATAKPFFVITNGTNDLNLLKRRDVSVCSE